MKNLRHALAFSVVVLLASGCPKKGMEPPERADASAADAAGVAPTGSSEQALADAGVVQAAATGEEDGGTTFERSDSLPPAAGAPAAGSVKQPAARAGADAGSAQAAGTSTDASAKAAREACVDRWLKAQKLDRYGHKQGTMYAGGSPLFDERTGETRDRIEYVFSRHAAAKQACPQ
jgi:hypothetical protein